ncbi:hypothetical protein CAOG_07833 [Capsaspora owczarzaki ATCC 30864]|uniref:HEAT repeat domain-containing protein n=1 Tax=Capsaspora owczarzaki (strain ATCC 30864) TaxID=595528 RepID=A0A0D2WY05_CAPO3|nr:hypothetical protein CAOG_07833 [Capsaspora owczarzaki ATCC 30864]KJE97728.1 hypothetical protein CAOG_007833 [Capsaspora owczarzaki ATCC 30864]|eukprot:XP_004342906.1 hypothetical protein CAOG_07833 [Capsaspora owczarzaki ATCC 30864]
MKNKSRSTPTVSPVDDAVCRLEPDKVAEVSIAAQCQSDANLSSEFKEFISRTLDPDPRVRKQMLKEMCPCRVRADIDLMWARIIELTSDESDIVRDQALHALGDGSPRAMEATVMEIAERLYNDPSDAVRSKARRMVNAYRRTGKWNVL